MSFILFLLIACVIFCNGIDVDATEERSWTGGMFSGKLYNEVKDAVRNMLGNKPALAKSEATDETPLSEAKIQNLLEFSKELIRNGQIVESIDNLLSIYDNNPSHQECNSLLGGVLMTVQQETLAEEFLYSAVQLSNWTDAISVANLAESLRQNDKGDLGLKVLIRGFNAINSTDKTGVLSRSIGNIHYFEKNYSLAADWFLNAVLSHPFGGADDWLKASTMAFPPSAQDLKFAENVLLQAIIALPQSSSLFYYLGLVMQLTDREEQSIVFYHEALRLDENNYPAISSLATAYHALGQFENAFRAYNVALNVDSGNVIMLVNFGKLLHMNGQTNDCVEMARKAMEVDASNIEVQQLSALCRVQGTVE